MMNHAPSCPCKACANYVYVCPFCWKTAHGGMDFRPADHYCHKVNAMVELIHTSELEIKKRKP